MRPTCSMLTLAGLFSLAAVGHVSAQQKLAPTPVGKETGLIPREVLFGNPDKAQARLSPDGKYLSYLAPVDGVLNVWVAPADAPEKARPITHDKKRGIRSHSWTFTNRHILYLQDADGDENWRIYVVNVETGKARNLTPKASKANPKQKVQARIQEVSHKFPNEILVALNDRNPRFHDIYRINLLTGKKKLVQKNDGYVGFLTDDDFRVRFAFRFNLLSGNLEVLEPAPKGKWKKFMDIPSADSMTTQPIAFDKTGKILYLIDSRDRNTAALVAFNLETGKQKVIASNAKADIGGVMMHPTEKTIQAYSYNYTRVKWVPLDPKVAKDLKRLEKVADGDLSLASRTLDDRVWIVAYTMDNGPLRYYRYDRDTGKASFLFSNRSDLEKWPLQKMHPVVIKSRDGLDLVSYLTLPYGSDPDGDARPERPVPMVLYVHGGPWSRDTWGFNPVHQFLANRGYAVLSVNYRGSTGFGKNFINAANGEWAGKMHDDLIDAVDWAIANKIAIPDKVAIMGGSYGGYATLVGLTFTPEKFACGVDIVGPSNLVTLLKNIPPYWFPILPQLRQRVFDFTTPEGRKLLVERSPLTHVDKIKRPLLIGQGANDPRVKKVESDQIVEAMQKKKLPVTYVLFPDEGHGFARPENRLAFFAVTEAFLARQLGGRYQAIGDAFKGSTIQVPTGAEHVPGLQAALKAKD